MGVRLPDSLNLMMKAKEGREKYKRKINISPKGACCTIIERKERREHEQSTDGGTGTCLPDLVISVVIDIVIATDSRSLVDQKTEKILF